MRTVWKFEVPVDGQPHTLNLPAGADIVAAVSMAVMAFWATVDDAQKVTDPRTFEVIGTGHPEPFEKRQHLGVAQAGPLVWHLYEAIR